MTRKNNSRNRKRANWPFACLCGHPYRRCKLQQVPPALQLFRHLGGVPKGRKYAHSGEKIPKGYREKEFCVVVNMSFPA